MSELKRFNVVCKYSDEETMLEYRPDGIYYDADEADAVIAEKDAEIAKLKAQKAQAEDDCAYWKMCHGNAEKAMYETEEYAMQLYKESRHNKYKRCVTMTKWCENALLGWMGYKESFSSHQRYVKVMLFTKWHKRWLELAEKFKLNKSTAH